MNQNTESTEPTESTQIPNPLKFPKLPKLPKFSKILCFFGVHDYKVVGFFEFIDTSFAAEASSTKITKVCKRCGKIVVERFYGLRFTDEEKEAIRKTIEGA